MSVEPTYSASRRTAWKDWSAGRRGATVEVEGLATCCLSLANGAGGHLRRGHVGMHKVFSQTKVSHQARCTERLERYSSKYLSQSPVRT